MNKPEAASLPFYRSPSFSAVKIPLRDPDRETHHLGAENQDAAAMSTITDLLVAVGYAVRKSQMGGGLLIRIVTKNEEQSSKGYCLLCSVVPHILPSLFVHFL